MTFDSYWGQITIETTWQTRTLPNTFLVGIKTMCFLMSLEKLHSYVTTVSKLLSH